MLKDADDIVSRSAGGNLSDRRQIMAYYEEGRKGLLAQDTDARWAWLRQRYAAAGLKFDEVRAAMEKHDAFPELLKSTELGIQRRYLRIVDAYVMRDAQELLEAMVGKHASADKLEKEEAENTCERGVLGMFSDLLGSATRNMVGGKPAGCGHTNAYYDERPGYGQQIESFANIVALEGEGNRFWRKLLARFTPRMYGVFKEAVK